MAKYLLKVNYTVDGLKGLLAEGGSARRKVAEAAANSVGGSIESFYFAFGGTDVFIIADFPDKEAAAALAMTVTASGGATVETVVLLTPDEADAAVAKQIAYTPPGG